MAKVIKGKNQHAVGAGCLYLVCRDSGMPRTFKEIETVLPTNVTVGRGRAPSVVRGHP